MIYIYSVSKIFNQGKTTVNALQDISLHIHKGDIFGIIGMSGAGKSTLLRCLCALEQPTKGEITINKISTTNIKNGKLTALTFK